MPGQTQMLGRMNWAKNRVIGGIVLLPLPFTSTTARFYATS